MEGCVPLQKAQGAQGACHQHPCEKLWGGEGSGRGKGEVMRICIREE